MITEAVNANQLMAELLVEELVRLGVTTYFLSPGSRSAPLAVAAAGHPATTCVVHFDERGSAFAAVGYGRVSKTPAAWITTSGTAVANGLPAVVEASVDGVPLVALTADRPPEMRNTGSNQTVEQPGIFGKYTRWEFDLPPASPDVDPTFVLTTVDQAVHRALTDRGPVHLNCMFREPLHPGPDGSFRFSPSPALTRWLHTSRPYTKYDAGDRQISSEILDIVAEAIRSGEPGLVVAGRLASVAEGAAVAAVAQRLGWPLLPDVLSFVRHASSERTMSYFDLMLARDDVRDGLRPGTVIHFGGRVTSKRMYQHFQVQPPDRFVLVSPLPERIDPLHIVTHRIEADVEQVCSRLLNEIPAGTSRPVGPGSADPLFRAQLSVDRLLDERLAELPGVSEPYVARQIARLLPPDHALFLGSSMPIRDVDSFAPAGAGLPAWANRGASGIDGTLASAVGLSLGRRGPVTVLLGDLALLHDLNSLALVRSVQHPVVVVVINNDGGGIFSFLPVADYPEHFEQCFGTPHGLSFESAASMFGLAYQRVRESSVFEKAYADFCRSGTSALLEVVTDRRANRVLHEDLVDAVRKMKVEPAHAQPSIPHRVKTTSFWTPLRRPREQ